MPHAARPIAFSVRALGLGLVAALLAPSIAVADPLLPDDAAALGRQQAVAISHQVVVTWTVGALGATAGERSAALRQASRTRRVAEAAGTRARFVREFGPSGRTAIYRLEEALGRRAGRTLDAIARMPGVESVEPDPWVTIDGLPDDNFANYVWGSLGPGDATVYGTATYGVNADDAWPTSTGSGAKVAVLDTGWVAHGDLAGQSLPGYDFVTDAWSANDGGGRDSDPSDPGDWIDEADNALYPDCAVDDSSWHGLHVSGTIAGIANNAYGTFGVAPDARIVPVRVLGKCGGVLSDITDAITWASGGTVPGVPANPNPVDVINLSLGGPSACPTYLQSAISGARAAGTVVVVAAGNSAMNAADFAPANCHGTLVVGATDIAGKRASFSNYGSVVDVAAPGSEIVSTYNEGATSPSAGDALFEMDGTSMATPHVAAVAALLFALDPAPTRAQVEYAITHGTTAFPADATAHGCSTQGNCGSGIASAPGALAALGPVEQDPPLAIVVRPAQFTNAASPVWSVAFDEPVTGLAAGDFSIAGSATGCSVQAPGGGGESWTVAVSGCTEGTVTLTLNAGTVTDELGNPGPAGSTAAAIATIDRTAPTVTRASVTPRKGQKLAGTSVPVTVAWSGADAGGSGIASYALQRSTDGGVSWITLATTGATSASTTQATSGSVRFRVIATDRAGNKVAGAASATSRASLVQTSGVTFARTWSKQTASRYSGGSVKWSKSWKASATLTFTGRSIAFVTTRAATRGKVKIYVGSVLQGTYDLRGATTYRVIAWQRTWATTRKRTVRIVVLATPGRPRVDVDAFVILR